MYLNFAGGEDIETQRNGMVMIFWPGSGTNLRPPNLTFRRMVGRVIQCVPTRFASFHLCFPASNFFRVIGALVSAALSLADVATRVKAHTGMVL